MNLAAPVTALARGAARHPRVTLAAAVLLALVAGAFALTLRATTATDTLVSRSSAAFQATQSYHRQFGDDAVVVLVQEPLSTLLLGKDIDPLVGLEGCLSGNVPAGGAPAGGARGPCAQIAAEHATHLVFGPGTFLNSAAHQITSQLTAQAQQAQSKAQRDAASAYQLALARGRSKAAATKLASSTQSIEQTAFVNNLLTVGRQYGLGPTTLPDVHNSGFVSKIVFDPTTHQPKARFSSLFPNSQDAIIQVRLNAGLPDSRRDRAIALIRRATQMPEWRLQAGGYVVTGVPVIVADLSGSITNSLELLLVGALLVMALVLALVFSGRPRLLPLLVALLATAYTFGLLAVSGASLTMASIGVLPVLIGLTVDYAIQFQSRVGEEAGGGAEPAVRRAARLGGPTIAIAGAATAGGFLILSLPVVGSPVPMVRDFGLLLVVGVVIGLLTAFTAGTAAIVLAERRRAPAPLPPLLPRLWGALAPSPRGAELLLKDNRAAPAVDARARASGSYASEH
ncbi:MAG: MMPL family transporter, partial [Solirubrobacteraceae bacterium]